MSEGGGSDRGGPSDAAVEPLGGLADREGWRVDGAAARVHYEGEGDRYSVEYYSPSDCVVYWKVPPEAGGETAVPVGRETVPTPLRERIRIDLDEAGIDPEIERRSL
ncbi:hypothetical protein C475_16871 [Halosimplex carlsbadense 2-9-1]|uniref:Dehydrogenase n=1 Tax=Halosimplex carlsbadense 2-9-1 TaxID=797114 RepID=M0CLN4_9EURY|nr:hypothetical protein [Halosimplex carlsbadense]ELZ22794.1 hypothetical protein C475_16871 [Halosimplex carlsbadense 2-9-1]